MRRFGLIFLFLTTLLFGNILDKDVAFKLNVSSDLQGILLRFSIDESVYLYKDKIGINIKNTDILPMIDLPEFTIKDEHKIYKDKLEIFIPRGLALNFGEKIKLGVSYQGCANSGFCYSPTKVNFDVDLKTGEVKKAHKAHKLAEHEQIANSLTNSFWLSLLSFFGYGLLLSLTPCVFPMIPVVATIVVAKCGVNSSAKSGFFVSLIYVLAMSLTYALAGVGASLLGASVQGFLQKPFVIVVSAVIFVFLALATFDLFTIQMPQYLQNYLSKKSNSVGGIIGVAFMGILGALIVGPCVAAPLAGALLYIAQSNDAFFGGLALFVMSLGMGAPLLLVGLGVKILPKPGFWMNEIRKLLGFLMLAMAILMLSRVIGESETNLLYGILCIFVGVFFGAFDTAQNGATKFIKSCAIIILIFGATFIFEFTSKFVNPNSHQNTQIQNSIKFKNIANSHELHEIISSSNKPVMLDFWATWCENCKEFEKKTFSDIKVRQRLENFVLLKADVSANSDENLALMKEFGVFGPPAILFFSEGKEKSEKRIIGYVNSREFIEKTKDF